MTCNLEFAQNFSSSNVKIFEVSNDILKEIEQGNVSIKGRISDEAVLCTSSRTFSVKVAESTNTLLLVSSSIHGNCEKEHIIGSLSSHFELVEIVPKLQTLKILLSERLYSGPEEELKRKGRNYTLDQLRAIVQASEQELRTALKALNAFEFEGHWRIMSQSFMGDIIELILTEAVSSDWNLNRISQKACIEALEPAGFDPWCIAFCLATYAISTTSYNADTLHSLDLNKLCAFKGIQLLQQTKVWPLDSFMATWTSAVPEGAPQVTTELLKGHAVITSEGPTSSIFYFPVDSLSIDVHARFKELFTVKNHWSLAEIEPYIRDLVPPSQNLEQYLLKFARALPFSQGTHVQGTMYAAK